MGIREREIDTPLENLGCRPLRWPIRRAEAPLRICNFSRCLERRGRRKAHIREGELEREAGDHPNFTSGGYDLLGAKGAANRAIAVHDRPTIKRSGPTAPVRACERERGMVGST